MESPGRAATGSSNRYYDVLVLNSEENERDGRNLCDLIEQEAREFGKTVRTELLKWADFASNEHLQIDKAIDNCLVLLLLLTPKVPEDREVFFKFCSAIQSVFDHKDQGHLIIRVVYAPDRKSVPYYDELSFVIKTVPWFNLDWKQPESFITGLFHLLESEACRDRQRWIEGQLDGRNEEDSGRQQENISIRVHAQCTEDSTP